MQMDVSAARTRACPVGNYGVGIVVVLQKENLDAVTG